MTPDQPDRVAPTCEMADDCTEPVTYIDEKGFVYCTGHGRTRQQYKRCRKLRPHELNRVRHGKPVAKY